VVIAHNLGDIACGEGSADCSAGGFNGRAVAGGIGTGRDREAERREESDGAEEMCGLHRECLSWD